MAGSTFQTNPYDLGYSRRKFLGSDPVFGRLLRNVLYRFGVR